MTNSTWNWFYTGTLDNINAAIAQINSNCGFPNGSTESWAQSRQNYSDPTTYFFLMPPPDGYKDDVGSWTQSQMIENIVNVETQQSQPNWWPTFPPN